MNWAERFLYVGLLIGFVFMVLDMLFGFKKGERKDG